MSRPFSPRHAPAGPSLRINGKIRAREVRVIGDDGQQLGVIPLSEAIVLARNKAVDLVEIAPNANPPVCRLIEFGKYKYEMEKRQKENRKSQHANKVKEIQLSANIDPHDFKTKVSHAVDFLCEDMKVKASLRFRGREMAHTEFGFRVVRQFITDIAPWGHPDFEPKLTGRSINVMVSPLPKTKRAKRPDDLPTAPEDASEPSSDADDDAQDNDSESESESQPSAEKAPPQSQEKGPAPASETPASETPRA